MRISPIGHFRHTRTARAAVGGVGIGLLVAAAVAAGPSGSALAAPGTPTSGAVAPPSAAGAVEPTPAPATGKAAIAPVPRVITPNFRAGGPGPAGPPIDTVVRAAVAAPATYTPCHPGGASTADVALAAAVRPYLTGGLAAQSPTSLAESVSCARVIVATIAANRMDRQAAVIALATTVVESGMKNVTYGDRDSLGLFQQRPSQGWGTVAQVEDPVYATNAFLAAMVRNFPAGVWQYRAAGVVAQGVQISAFPDRYEPQAADGVQLVSRLWTETSQLYTFAGGGTVYRSAPSTCTTTMCSTGAVRVDDNTETTGVTAGYGTYEYQRTTGQLWRATGTACGTSSCPGWTQVDRNPRTTTVVAGLGGVYEFQATTGQLWQYTGSPCTTGGCFGWRLIDRNPATTTVVASSTGLFQYQRSTGQLWRFTGRPCSSGCTGWVQVAVVTPGSTVSIGTRLVAVWNPSTGATTLASNGTCASSGCLSFRPIGTDRGVTTIVSNAVSLWKFVASTHQIWRYTGTAWVLLDVNPSTSGIVTSPTSVLQLHADTGDVWTWTGAVCSVGCPGWAKIATRPGAAGLVAT